MKADIMPTGQPVPAIEIAMLRAILGVFLSFCMMRIRGPGMLRFFGLCLLLLRVRAPFDRNRYGNPFHETPSGLA